MRLFNLRPAVAVPLEVRLWDRRNNPNPWIPTIKMRFARFHCVSPSFLLFCKARSALSSASICTASCLRPLERRLLNRLRYFFSQNPRISLLGELRCVRSKIFYRLLPASSSSPDFVPTFRAIAPSRGYLRRDPTTSQPLYRILISTHRHNVHVPRSSWNGACYPCQ